MSLLYTGNVSDKQSRLERLFILTVLAITLVTATWIWGHDRGEPAMHEVPAQCAAEDEVMVRVQGDAYDLNDGDLMCIHIDVVADSKEPTR